MEDIDKSKKSTIALKIGNIDKLVAIKRMYGFKSMDEVIQYVLTMGDK